jgi:hypothetical protein
MANIIVNVKAKYRQTMKSGNKEVEQHFEDFEQTINLSEDNYTLLKAAISGLVDAADGATE